MATVLGTKAPEEGTYILTVAFKDDTGTAVVPDSITWTETDTSGSVVNSRLNVAVAVPAASITIVLSGADLAIQRPSILGRIVTIEAVYDSDAGNDLPLNAEIRFTIEPLVNIP